MLGGFLMHRATEELQNVTILSFFFFFFVFLGLHPWHMEVPSPGVESHTL